MNEAFTFSLKMQICNSYKSDLAKKAAAQAIMNRT